MPAISISEANARLLPDKISGFVLDPNGAPIPNTTVTLKGTNESVVSGSAGSFKISVGVDVASPVLIFSSVGYLSREVEVGSQLSLTVRLEIDNRNLGEVVVIGYGPQKRKDLTGSIATVSSAQIAERPVSGYQDALAGLIPGIDIAPRSANPGNVPEITIRGIGTISGGRDPLYVVDGFPTDAANAMAIDPTDISSVDVLKDASSTSIYGSRGANGVIIITTKSGHEGSSSVNVNVKEGFSRANKHDFYSVMNGAQYTEWYKEKAQFAGVPVPSWITNWDGTSTNWQDVIYRIAPFQNINISTSGGTKKLSYLFSGGYLDQGDIHKK